MKEFHPEPLKKFTGTLPNVDLYFDNFELWMTVMSAVEWNKSNHKFCVVGIRAFIPHEKQKNFFDLCGKKCHFSKFSMLTHTPKRVSIFEF